MFNHMQGMLVNLKMIPSCKAAKYTLFCKFEFFLRVQMGNKSLLGRQPKRHMVNQKTELVAHRANWQES